MANLIIGGVMSFGALAVNGPTILNCIKNKSTEGISFAAQKQEFYTAIVSLAYSYHTLPLNQYVEGIIAIAQTCILIILIWLFNKSKAGSILIDLAGFLLSAAICFRFPLVLSYVGCSGSPFCSIDVLTTISTVFLISARATQIIQNIKQGSMGNISISQPIILLVGAGMRIYTLMSAETIVWGALIPYLVSAFLTLISFIQFFIYNGRKPKTA